MCTRRYVCVCLRGYVNTGVCVCVCLGAEGPQSGRKYEHARPAGVNKQLMTLSAGRGKTHRGYPSHHLFSVLPIVIYANKEGLNILKQMFFHFEVKCKCLL